MQRLAIVFLLLGVLIISPALVHSVSRTDSEQDAAIDRLNCTTYGEDCATPEPHTATPDATPEATATGTPTPDPTATPAPVLTGWHTATDHEHGDAPPAWAVTWSQAAFGHGIVYGGDEATPNEDAMKHEAYKGYLLAQDGVEVYLRFHTQTNPHGRAARYHSYEIYAKDTTGAVSFWQGWLDFGSVPERRFSYTETTLTSINGTEAGGAFILAAARDTTTIDYMGRETWYTRNDTAEWSWTVEITYFDPSVWFAHGEHLSPNLMDPSSWDTTGGKGLDRHVRIRWNIPGSYATHPNRNSLDPRGWFCATVTGQIMTLGVTGPAACASDTLPQYIAPTMQPNGTGLVARRTFSCSQCSLPN